VAELDVSPAAHTLVAIGDTVRFVAEARDGNGHVVTGAEFVWSSDDESVVTVNAQGLATAAVNGSARVTATSGSQSASAEVTVEQEVTEVSVSRPPSVLEALGDTLRLSAEAVDANGHVVAGTAFTWTSGDTLIAVVDDAGLVTAVGNGEADIMAASGAVSGTAAVTVAQKLGAVAVSPSTGTLKAMGDTVRLLAEATDANGHPVAGTVFTWTSGNTLVAVVDSAGLVTAVGNGQTDIAAASGAVSGTATVTVAQQPGAVVVTPSTDTLVALGDTVRLSAEAMDSNGHSVSGTVFTWVSGDTLIAVVDGTGLVAAVGNGVTTVTAASSGAVGNAMVTVIQLADSVIVTPSADSVALDDTLSFSAEALDANGHAVVGATFRWSSSDPSVAPVDAGGQVYGFAEGAATISAEAGSAQGTAQITVFNPDRAALVALYEATDGPNWLNNENWLTDAPLGDWYGVRMLGDRVGYLDLDRNGLNGPIPAQLATLSWLRVLRLGQNALTGPIPPELADLARLDLLGLDRNELSGPIPPELGRLARLKWLILGGNALTGPIPAELGNTSLELLWLQDNKLTGSIPPELGKLKSLDSFLLDVNPGLRGEIPPEVLALPLERHFDSYATGLCVPRTGDFDSYIRRDGWIGYACGETEPGFQIELVFYPDVPSQIREAMHSQAEYWMEILRDTEAPDLFGVRRYHSPDWNQTPREVFDDIPHVFDDIVVIVRLAEVTGATLSGLTDLLRHRIPYQGGILFRAADATNTRWLDLIARNQLGHTFGIGSLWDIRGLLKNKSRAGEVRDTYVVSPLAQEAFDAAGGTSYTGPKVPVHQHGGGRNSNWRTEVFGSELMSWGWSDHVPTSAVTLQALADLGYKVDLSLADPYTLPGTAAATALRADEPTLELGWEAPPPVVVCRPQDDLLRELEILRPGLRLRHARFRPCQSAWATSPSSRSFPVPTPEAPPSKIQSRPPDS
ncbi:MAG: Ig-like domain-containing protein, partial [Rhodospirillales bacterium]|nr:Ig-like domain-containing protein [Rhodospirillales bacterium]